MEPTFINGGGNGGFRPCAEGLQARLEQMLQATLFWLRTEGVLSLSFREGILHRRTFTPQKRPFGRGTA
ncbi:MAG: hypothetical protein WBC82_10770, partial [Dehalococcoidia bacterium]